EVHVRGAWAILRSVTGRLCVLARRHNVRARAGLARGKHRGDAMNIDRTMSNGTLPLRAPDSEPESSAYPTTSMRVTKRSGRTETVDLNKIVRAVSRCAAGLTDVDPMRIATLTISGLYDGATTSELDRLSIQTAAAYIVEEPQYAKLSGRLLAAYIE